MVVAVEEAVEVVPVEVRAVRAVAVEEVAEDAIQELPLPTTGS